MLTQGQIVFASLFVVAFTLIMFFSYRKDKKLHTKNYKGAIWVLIAFITFIILLFLIKYLLKN